MNLVTALQPWVEKQPHVAALVDVHRGRDRITTFADLELASCRAARLLAGLGLKQGDPVLVFYPMSAELYAALIAIFRLGLTAMFLDPSAGRQHIERCCSLAPPRALIAGPKAHLLRLLSPALRRIPHKLVVGFPLPFTTRWSRADALEPLSTVVPCADAAAALLTFTSGSTGVPRAAVRTHGFLLAQHQALAASLRLTPGDVDLATLPIVLLANLASGVTSVVPDADLRSPGLIDPAPVVAQVLRHRVNSSVASPAFFERLAGHCERSRLELPTLDKLFTGGAPVFPRILERMQAMAPRADVVALYGSTEAEPIAHVSRSDMTPEDLRAMLAGRGLLAGHPVKEIDLRILRSHWGAPLTPPDQAALDALTLPPGQPGEIVVRGDHVLRGYLHGRGDEETKVRLGDEVWHRTGDAGYLDERGRLWLLGRCAARIEDGRGELYPFAAETAAYQDRHVRRAAVVSHRGRRLLILEPEEGREAVDLARIRSDLAWASLDEVLLWKRIPVDRRHNAKIDYPALTQMLESEGRR